MAVQGIYRKGLKYVAVKQTRLASNSILRLGEEVPSKKFPLKEFHLRSLFSRKRIGFLDSPWANTILDAHKASEEEATPEVVDPEEELVEDVKKTPWAK